MAKHQFWRDDWQGRQNHSAYWSPKTTQIDVELERGRVDRQRCCTWRWLLHNWLNHRWEINLWVHSRQERGKGPFWLRKGLGCSGRYRGRHLRSSMICIGLTPRIMVDLPIHNPIGASGDAINMMYNMREYAYFGVIGAQASDFERNFPV